MRHGHTEHYLEQLHEAATLTAGCTFRTVGYKRDYTIICSLNMARYVLIVSLRVAAHSRINSQCSSPCTPAWGCIHGIQNWHQCTEICYHGVAQSKAVRPGWIDLVKQDGRDRAPQTRADRCHLSSAHHRPYNAVWPGFCTVVALQVHARAAVPKQRAPPE